MSSLREREIRKGGLDSRWIEARVRKMLQERSPARHDVQLAQPPDIRVGQPAYRQRLVEWRCVPRWRCLDRQVVRAYGDRLGGLCARAPGQ